MTDGQETAAQLLNVDLDIRSKESLGDLLTAMESYAFALHNDETTEDGFFLCLVLNEESPDADSSISGFVELLRRLPAPARGAWDGAFRRTFDIGIQAGHHPYSLSEVLKPETIQAVGSLGAGINITVYAPTTAR